MDFTSLSDWGSAASIVGLVVAAGGLLAVGYQAWGAKRAANQTRKVITNVLIHGSGSRATTMIQEIKNALQKGQWEVGYQLCHTLRGLLGDLRTLNLASESAQSLGTAMESLTAIENELDAAIRKVRGQPQGKHNFNATLSQIQDVLEGIMSEAALRQGERRND